LPFQKIAIAIVIIFDLDSDKKAIRGQALPRVFLTA
jgi:hypothetical protein